MSVSRRRFIVAAVVTAAGGATMGILAGTRRPDAITPPRASTGPRIGTTTEATERPIRGGRLATRFDGVAGPPAWSPDASALCVQHAGAVGRQVAVYESSSWTRRFVAAGALPAWSPDGAALAVVDPAPRTIPLTADNEVLVLDAKSGRQLRTFSTRATSVGWGAAGLVAAVDGEIVDLYSGRESGCDGACGVVTWSSDARYAATSDPRSAEARYAVRDTVTAQRLADLGVSGGPIAWASSASVLAGTFDGVPVTWRPHQSTPLTLPAEFAPIACSPRGGVILLAATRGDVLSWRQLLLADGRIEHVQLPLSSTRSVTWSPDGRFLSCIPSTFGRSASLEIVELDY